MSGCTSLASDSVATSEITKAWLARSGRGSGAYGDRFFNWMVIAPARLADSRLTEHAVRT
jgi:hypothetical protein